MTQIQDIIFSSSHHSLCVYVLCVSSIEVHVCADACVCIYMQWEAREKVFGIPCNSSSPCSFWARVSSWVKSYILAEW